MSKRPVVGMYERVVCGRHLATATCQWSTVFDRITNKPFASKLGCMALVNIWQDTVLYDELTINEHQKSDLVFSYM